MCILIIVIYLKNANAIIIILIKTVLISEHNSVQNFHLSRYQESWYQIIFRKVIIDQLSTAVEHY